MTNAQKLQLRASEIRQRLNEINGLEGDSYSTEIRSESDTLTTEFTDIETRLRAALVIEGDETAKRDLAYQTGETPEARELRALTGRANAGAIILGPCRRNGPVSVPSWNSNRRTTWPRIRSRSICFASSSGPLA